MTRQAQDICLPHQFPMPLALESFIAAATKGCLGQAGMCGGGHVGPAGFLPTLAISTDCLARSEPKTVMDGRPQMTRLVGMNASAYWVLAVVFSHCGGGGKDKEV